MFLSVYVKVFFKTLSVDLNIFILCRLFNLLFRRNLFTLIFHDGIASWFCFCCFSLFMSLFPSGLYKPLFLRMLQILFSHSTQLFSIILFLPMVSDISIVLSFPPFQISLWTQMPYLYFKFRMCKSRCIKMPTIACYVHTIEMPNIVPAE